MKIFSRKCILTLSNGCRVAAEIDIPQTGKPFFHEEMERRVVEEFNKYQPHAVNKVLACHILRN